MKTVLIDRRKSVRIKGDFFLQIGKNKKLKVGRTVDLSLRGMCCEVDGKVPVFEEMDIRFDLPTYGKNSPKKDKVHFKGVLVRCEPTKSHGKYTMAFYFTDWDALSRRKLEKYIKKSLYPESKAA